MANGISIYKAQPDKYSGMVDVDVHMVMMLIEKDYNFFGKKEWRKIKKRRQQLTIFEVHIPQYVLLLILSEWSAVSFFCMDLQEQGKHLSAKH